MKFKNLVILRGNLVKDPQIYEYETVRKAILRIAIGLRGSKNRNFINVEAFLSKNAHDDGIYGFIKKGDEITVQGEMRSSRYERNGKVYDREYVVVKNIRLERRAARNIKDTDKNSKNDTRWNDLADGSDEGNIPF